MEAIPSLVRQLQPCDVHDVERLHKYATHEGQPVFPQYGEDAARVLNAAAASEDSAFGLVALLSDPEEPDEEEVVGAVTAQLSCSNSQHSPSGVVHQQQQQQQQVCEVVLLTLAVRADMRQQGVGRRLFEAMLQRAQHQAQAAHGCSCVRVVTDIALSNKPAWRFFQSLGFCRGDASSTTAEAVLVLDQLSVLAQSGSYCGSADVGSGPAAALPSIARMRLSSRNAGSSHLQHGMLLRHRTRRMLTNRSCTNIRYRSVLRCTGLA